MTTPKVLIICQARLGSTRLPRKVMLPLAGAPLLIRQLDRVRRSKYGSNLVVATTTNLADRPLVELCMARGIDVYRGHPTDLLDRHYHCANEYEADIVVKIPSDCPLIDPLIIDRVVDRFIALNGSVDYVSNLHPPSYPDGNDVEVMSMDVLRQAHLRATQSHEREHTTPWMWDDNPKVRCENVLWERGVDYSMSHRWTIDYPEDYMLIKAIYDALFSVTPDFGIENILLFLNEHPEVMEINKHLVGVNWYHLHLDLLQTVRPSDTRTPRSRFA